MTFTNYQEVNDGAQFQHLVLTDCFESQLMLTSVIIMLLARYFHMKLVKLFVIKHFNDLEIVYFVYSDALK